MAEVPADLWTLDAHCDSIILRFYNKHALDLSPVEHDYHVTVPRLRAGKITGLFAMVGDKHLIPSLQMIDAMHQVCAAQRQTFALCLNAADVRAAVAAGRIAIVMTIEGQSMFEEHVEMVRNWHRLGVRLYSLTHGEAVDSTPGALQGTRSHFGYLAPAERAALRKTQKGLTDFARASLREMGRLGIPCDLAHANDAAFWEAIESAPGPLCYTHGNCYALCPHTRNLTDEMMKALAQRRGVIGLCFYGRFIHETEPSLERYVDHIMHALEVMGEDCMGIGTDFDGVEEDAFMAVKDASAMNELWEALDRRGVRRAALVKIAHDNFLRLIG